MLALSDALATRLHSSDIDKLAAFRSFLSSQNSSDVLKLEELTEVTQLAAVCYTCMAPPSRCSST